MRSLVAEDDPTCRETLVKLLERHGPVSTVADGAAAVKAVADSLANGEPFDLVCLDILMPVLDGRQALAAIRKIEAEHGIAGLACVKIIMTTVLSDKNSIFDAFRRQCEAYIVKPVSRDKLDRELRNLGLPA